MSAAIVIAAVGVAGSLALGINSAVNSGGQKTGTSTSQPEFPQETLRLIQDVENPLAQNILAQQAQLFSPFQTGPGGSPFIDQQYGGGIPGVAFGAAQKGAQTAGVTNLGPSAEIASGLTPELTASLSNLVLQRNAQINSIVPPGYGQFLSPGTFAQQQQLPAPPFQTGFALGSGISPFIQSGLTGQPLQ